MSWKNLGTYICVTVFTVDPLYSVDFLGLGLLYRGLLILGIRFIGELLHRRDTLGLPICGTRVTRAQAHTVPGELCGLACIVSRTVRLRCV